MNFRQNDIIILLGAGASLEAGISTSIRMIKDIEELLISRSEWQPYKKLYDYIKSSILYGMELMENLTMKFLIILKI